MAAHIFHVLTFANFSSSHSTDTSYELQQQRLKKSSTGLCEILKKKCLIFFFELHKTLRILFACFPVVKHEFFILVNGRFLHVFF